MASSCRRLTPLGALTRGLVAGATGTAAMTAWQSLSSRLQSSGEGDADSSAPEDPWEQASAPAKLGRRVIEGVFQREVGSDWIPLLTQVMHWGYGTSWGAAYGVIAPSLRRSSPLRHGVLFGSTVWVASYVTLVPTGLYQPPWRYKPQELALDLSYHLVYGTGAGVAYALMTRG